MQRISLTSVGFLDQAPNTEKITTAVVLNRLLALKSISHKHLQWSRTSNTLLFSFLVRCLTECDFKHQRATLPAVKPSTSHAETGQFKKRNVTLWTAAKKTSAGGDGKGWECLRMEKEKEKEIGVVIPGKNKEQPCPTDIKGRRRRWLVGDNGGGSSHAPFGCWMLDQTL